MTIPRQQSKFAKQIRRVLCRNDLLVIRITNSLTPNSLSLLVAEARLTQKPQKALRFRGGRVIYNYFFEE